MKGNWQKRIFWAVVLLINFQETIYMFESNEDSYSLSHEKVCICVIRQASLYPEFRRGKYINIILRYIKKAENHVKQCIEQRDLKTLL